MYRASAIKVMIASPSDVAHERQVFRDVVSEWNAVHSEDRRIVLMPIGWDTHSHPAMGDRPQAVINKQVLDGCDILVAAFWTRLGSPTGVAASGTVEEIEEHLKLGKPAMIYFSQSPVRPDSVDDEQYRALLEFRRACEARGVVEVYESIQEFREKFARQLAQALIHGFSDTVKDDSEDFVGSQRSRGEDPIIQTLGEDERQLLVAGSEDRAGSIMRLRSLGGMRVQANRREFCEAGNPRSEARWNAVIERLQLSGLIEDVGYKGELFRLTELGYKTADKLKAGIGAV